MRALVTTSGAAGHLGPLIPFARAIREQGGEVLVATRASQAAAVSAAGFAARPFADADPAARGAVFASLGGDLGSEEANRRVVSELFAGLDAEAALPGVLEACEEWGPDVVLSEACEFAGGLAAEHAGIPGVRVGISGAAMEARFMAWLGPALAPHRARLGLPPDPAARRLLDAPYFTLSPAALDDPGTGALPAARRFREDGGHDPAPLPDWWGGSDAPLVYLTLGTVAPAMGFFPGLYRAAIDAIAPLDARVLVTTGRDADPAALGPLPANVHAERWVAQADVMPHAAAMVCHGGFGTVRAGLAAGVPLAVLPLFADQPDNAARVHALGAGVAVAGPGELAAAVRALLDEPRYAARAAAVAEETRALPPVQEAARILQELAAA
ncbi:MAG TPA: glycosyltransferase [Solirubrobacteraceae bacterium]|jgi:UDP:flavonoid glycosyltransferase YjiC (YdhE family)|nr:glycosyltransferase [Solirubrobacteraceae bacterium]